MRAGRANKDGENLLELAPGATVDAAEEADFALLAILGDVQFGGGAGGARIGVYARRVGEAGHPGRWESEFVDVGGGFADIAALDEDGIADEAGKVNAVEGFAALAGLVGFGEERGFLFEEAREEPFGSGVG
ncbi:MAG: hypothetical protein FJ387_28665 [Verrucomicrobia bacterium]|nr:hypothetical protein [Verrucomicrobiota bacterium]